MALIIQAGCQKLGHCLEILVIALHGLRRKHPIIQLYLPGTIFVPLPASR